MVSITFYQNKKVFIKSHCHGQGLTYFITVGIFTLTKSEMFLSARNLRVSRESREKSFLVGGLKLFGSVSLNELIAFC